MSLRPKDLVVVLAHALWPGRRWTYQQLADALRMSPSEAHAGVARGLLCGLLFRDGSSWPKPNVANLLEFAVHGVKYAFVAKRVGSTRGHPTASAAPVLERSFGGPGPAPAVWPGATGPVWGEGLAPLYPRAVEAALADERLYAALALLDTLRTGGARERAIAETVLRKLLEGGAAP